MAKSPAVPKQKAAPKPTVRVHLRVPNGVKLEIKREVIPVGACMTVHISTPQDGCTTALDGNDSFTITGETDNYVNADNVTTKAALINADETELDGQLTSTSNVNWTFDFTVLDDAFKNQVVTLQVSSEEDAVTATGAVQRNRACCAISLILN
jgi:hypothetical protein